MRITETGCPCGSKPCVNHNRGWFQRLKPDPRVRAVVFWWGVRRCWTWCPVVNGTPEDQGFVMGHYDTLQLAFADADAYTRGLYPADAAVRGQR